MEVEIGEEDGQVGGELHAVDHADIIVLLGKLLQKRAGFMEGLGLGDLLPVGAPDGKDGKNTRVGVKGRQLGIEGVGISLKRLGGLPGPVVGAERNGDQIRLEGQLLVKNGSVGYRYRTYYDELVG